MPLERFGQSLPDDPPASLYWRLGTIQSVSVSAKPVVVGHRCQPSTLVGIVSMRDLALSIARE